MNAYNRFYNRTISQVLVSFLKLLALPGRRVSSLFPDIHSCFHKRIIVENCFSNIKKFGFFQRRKRR